MFIIGITSNFSSRAFSVSAPSTWKFELFASTHSFYRYQCIADVARQCTPCKMDLPVLDSKTGHNQLPHSRGVSPQVTLQWRRCSSRHAPIEPIVQ